MSRMVSALDSSINDRKPSTLTATFLQTDIMEYNKKGVHNKKE